MADEKQNDHSVSVNANSSANAGNNTTSENEISLSNSTLQTLKEFDKDKHGDHSREDKKVTASDVDDLQSNSDGAAGTDRAGTAERKSYGDPELNKGLEAQAKDLEGS